jgi:MYXO-CTERM domain-containing protein
MPAGDGAVSGDTGAVSGDTGAVAAPDARPSLEDSSGGSALAPGEETRGLSGGCSMPAASPPWPPLSLVLLGLLVVLRRR